MKPSERRRYPSGLPAPLLLLRPSSLRGALPRPSAGPASLSGLKPSRNTVLSGCHVFPGWHTSLVRDVSLECRNFRGFPVSDPRAGAAFAGGDDCHDPHSSRLPGSRRHRSTRPADGAGCRCPCRERSAGPRDRLAWRRFPLGGESRRPAVPRPPSPPGPSEGRRRHLPARRRLVHRADGQAESPLSVACRSMCLMAVREVYNA